MWETIVAVAIVAAVLALGGWRFYLVATGKAKGGCCGCGDASCAVGEDEERTPSSTHKESQTPSKSS